MRPAAAALTNPASAIVAFRWELSPAAGLPELLLLLPLLVDNLLQRDRLRGSFYWSLVLFFERLTAQAAEAPYANI